MSRILLVEDDADVRLLLEHILLDAGYEVETAPGVAAAFVRLADGRFDLVVADGRLEDGTGMMVADRAGKAGTATLIVTAYAFGLAKRQLGNYDFLLKPLRPAELVEAVERALRRAPS